jgi:hypothetical protein
MTLAPCPSCSRHVKTSETACPFCKAAIAPGAAVAIPGPPRRLSRAAAYAFTASLAIAGCEGGTAQIGDAGTTDEGGSGGEGGTRDGGTDAPPDNGNIQPPYGAPAYGAPPPVDSGTKG